MICLKYFPTDQSFWEAPGPFNIFLIVRINQPLLFGLICLRDTWTSPSYDIRMRLVNKVLVVHIYESIPNTSESLEEYSFFYIVLVITDNKLGLNWAKLSSNWNWNWVLLDLGFVSLSWFTKILMATLTATSKYPAEH